MRLLVWTLSAALLAGCFREPPPEIAEFIPPPAAEPVQEETDLEIVPDEPAPLAEIVEPEPEPEVRDAAPPPPPAAPDEPAISNAALAPSPLGTWRVVSMIREGQSQMPPGMDFVIRLVEDGTMTVTMSAPQLPKPMSRQGTWSQSGDAFTMTVEGDTQSGTYVLTQTTLTLDFTEMTLELHRM